MYGQAEIVGLLLEAGAYKDLKADNGVTPVVMAAENGHVAVVSLAQKTFLVFQCLKVKKLVP